MQDVESRVGRSTDTSPSEQAAIRKHPDSSVEKSGSAHIWRYALREAGWALATAAVLLATVYTVSFKDFHPEFANFMDYGATPLTAWGNDFYPASLGKGKRVGNHFIVEDFNDDEAVLVLPRPFVAEDYPFIKVNLSGLTRYSKAKILWQREGESEIHALELNRSGNELTQVAMVTGGEQYAGRISSIALLIYDGPAIGFENNNGVDIIIESVEFRPFSAMWVAEQIIEDWTNPPLWQGYSNNVVRGIHENGMVNPNATTFTLIVMALGVVATTRLVRKRLAIAPTANQLLATTLCLCLYGWAINDLLRWNWRAEQLIDTYERYGGLPLEERIRNSDIRCVRAPKDCGQHLLPYF